MINTRGSAIIMTEDITVAYFRMVNCHGTANARLHWGDARPLLAGQQSNRTRPGVAVPESQRSLADPSSCALKGSSSMTPATLSRVQRTTPLRSRPEGRVTLTRRPLAK